MHTLRKLFAKLKKKRISNRWVLLNTGSQSSVWQWIIVLRRTCSRVFKSRGWGFLQHLSKNIGWSSSTSLKKSIRFKNKILKKLFYLFYALFFLYELCTVAFCWVQRFPSTAEKPGFIPTFSERSQRWAIAFNTSDFIVAIYAVILLVVTILFGLLSTLNYQMWPASFLLDTHKVWHTSLHSKLILLSVFNVGRERKGGGKSYKTYFDHQDGRHPLSNFHHYQPHLAWGSVRPIAVALPMLASLLWAWTSIIQTPEYGQIDEMIDDSW